ncbi:methylated-DNA--[protein]-cysteine S-methyltransferase [uncultured Photobacterium sp.]|uniref:methylated-DNA--[protein]-cysteine S-methyltransferase n=1 Tax=uncultured Photobacterium sp. TaxID=173973 RepID=UPI00263272B1|nr:methylated-DNA--[protein]-cysteine S-methyltransferase [uncultured Photobacterium sp.]
MIMYYDCLDTILGNIFLLADHQGLRQLTIGSDGFCPNTNWEHNPQFMSEYIHQLQQYLEGQRKTFTIPLAPQGSKFQQQVWQAITDIPYGSTSTYQQIAKAIHLPNVIQAIGMAKNVNPIPIIIPSHRVQSENNQLISSRYGKQFVLLLRALESGEIILHQTEKDSA